MTDQELADLLQQKADDGRAEANARDIQGCSMPELSHLILRYRFFEELAERVRLELL